MKSNQSTLRLRRFDVEEKRRKIADIEAMIADFERMSEDLGRQIEVEQNRAGITDVNHYNYPTFAKAALQRRENLRESIQGLTVQLEKARAELVIAEEELAKLVETEDEAAGGGDRRAAPRGRRYAAVTAITPQPLAARGA